LRETLPLIVYIYCHTEETQSQRPSGENSNPAVARMGLMSTLGWEKLFLKDEKQKYKW